MKLLYNTLFDHFRGSMSMKLHYTLNGEVFCFSKQDKRTYWVQQLRTGESFCIVKETHFLRKSSYYCKYVRSWNSLSIGTVTYELMLTRIKHSRLMEMVDHLLNFGFKGLGLATSSQVDALFSGHKPLEELSL